MPRLVFIDKHFAGRTYDLTVEKTTVGRTDVNTLVIHDDSVSADHCEILVNGPEVIVREHGSRNGTFVNGVRVTGQMPVLSGQIVRIGTVEARLELEPPAADDSSGLTAVIAHSHAMAAKRREQRLPKPASPVAIMDDGSPAALEDKTVLVAPSRSAPPSTPVPAPPSPPPAGRPMKPLIVTGVIAFVMLIILLAWVLWRGE